MHAADRFVIYDDVNYIKGGWINRNRIMVNSEPHMFTLPLRNAGSNVAINEIQIGGNDYLKWRNKFIRTLEQAYAKAPFRDGVIELVNNVINPDAHSLADLLLASIKAIKDRVGIGIEIISTTTNYGNEGLSGADRVIDICKREGASVYINPIGGKELYDADRFGNEGIELLFLRTRALNFAEFEDLQRQGLSIIDVMMWNSPERISAYLEEYDLV